MLLIFAMAFAAGCGNGEQKPVATQVAAKVNSDEITVHQINSVLARSPNVGPDAVDQAKREILDKLIDQQLARQRAIEKKLDQVPVVLQALEAARSEILARTYLEQIASGQPKPSPEDVKKYYSDHPELFAQRRVFNIEEIALVADDGVAADLRGQVGKARNMQEIADWLQSRGIKFVANRGARTAEQIPFDVLSVLQKTKDGEIRVVDSGDARRVIRVADSKLEPVDEATAGPRIAQFIYNQRSSEAIAKEMKQVRKQAKIEYVGEFAGGVSAADAKAQVQADTAAKAREEAKSREQLEAKARAEALSKARKEADAVARREAAAKPAPSKPAQVAPQSVEKGMRGL